MAELIQREQLARGHRDLIMIPLFRRGSWSHAPLLSACTDIHPPENLRGMKRDIKEVQWC